jgi:hypothetical protein
MSCSVAFSAFVTDRAGARCFTGSINDRMSAVKRLITETIIKDTLDAMA